MKREERGFTLLELVIALAMIGFVLAAASTFFISVVKQYKTQSRITESNLEGVLGLEILRQDLESMGFGLPWDMNGIGYTEAGPLNGAPDPPRAVGSVDATDNSDYLVLRSAGVGTDNAAGKWTTLRSGTMTRAWGSAEADFAAGDRVIVVSPGSSTATKKVLVTPAAGTDYNNLGGYTPGDPYQTNIVYGIAGGALKRPFNRADYYIADNAAFRTPTHCAPNTGVFVKAVMAHDDAGTRLLLPLLDCVADFQMVFGTDNNADGVTEWSTDVSYLSAADLRSQLVEVRAHILAHTGGRDEAYVYPQDNVYVGSEGVGRTFGLGGARNYRWKLYTINVKPGNLAD